MHVAGDYGILGIGGEFQLSSGHEFEEAVVKEKLVLAEQINEIERI